MTRTEIDMKKRAARERLRTTLGEPEVPIWIRASKKRSAEENTALIREVDAHISQISKFYRKPEGE